MAVSMMIASKKQSPIAVAVKKSRFAMLDDSDSTDSETASQSTRAPSKASLCESPVESDSEIIAESKCSEDFTVVRPKARRAAKPVEPAVASKTAAKAAKCSTSSSSGGGDADLWNMCYNDCVDDWAMRKGQRHAFTKKSKQEWSFKSVQRVAAGTQKRNNQRMGIKIVADAF